VQRHDEADAQTPVDPASHAPRGGPDGFLEPDEAPSSRVRSPADWSQTADLVEENARVVRIVDTERRAKHAHVQTQEPVSPEGILGGASWDDTDADTDGTDALEHRLASISEHFLRRFSQEI
jgi:hypothetical protein